MRLEDLNAQWMELPNWAAKDRPFYVGVSFNCPCDKCSKDPCPTCGHKPHSQRLIFKFWPPIDPTHVAATFTFTRENHTHTNGGGAVFDRVEGNTLETLTLASHACIDGHWAGRIINGELFNSP